MSLLRKRQAAFYYDIFPPITAITGYTIRLRKLSAKVRFFVGAQMGVSNTQRQSYQAAFLFVCSFVCLYFLLLFWGAVVVGGGGDFVCYCC